MTFSLFHFSFTHLNVYIVKYILLQYTIINTISGGQRRLIFTGNVKTNLHNKYTPGSGVGSHNTSVRRHLQRKATSNAYTLEQLKNKNIASKRVCCPSLTTNPSNKAFPY